MLIYFLIYRRAHEHITNNWYGNHSQTNDALHISAIVSVCREWQLHSVPLLDCGLGRTSLAFVCASLLSVIKVNVIHAAHWYFCATQRGDGFACARIN